MNGGKLVIGIETDTKSFDAQIEATKRKLELLEKSADETGIPEQFRRSKEETRALNVEIEKTRNQLLSLQNAQRRNNQEDTKSWKERTQSLKQFALGLIGIRGIYSLVRKASSAWLSQDTELAKKFQNMWLVIGAALQPVLEALANIFMKLIGYLNVFVKAFTGGKVDLIAKANAQALKKQSEAMKELKNQTYGFDELNIQQTSQSSSSSSGLGNIPEPELNEKVAKVIGDIGKGLGEISDWVEDNLGVNGPIALGIAAVIGTKMLGGGGTGLIGILLILEAIALALAGLETNEIFRNNTAGMAEYNNEIYKTTKRYKELSESGELTKEQQVAWGKDLKVLTGGIKAHSDSLKESNSILNNTTFEQAQLLVESKLLVESYEQMIDTNNMGAEAAQGYIDALDAQRTVMKNLGQDTSLIDKKIDLVKQSMDKLNQTKSHPTIEAEYKLLDKSGNIYEQIKNKLSKIAKGLPFSETSLKLIANLSNAQIDAFLKKFGLASGGILHKSALGSIVNNPGRGVYLGSNTIGGEAGKEGVIPLTDPNAMTELGETIGRYITVNLTNITKLDSKTINRENKKIGNDMEFIRNGGGA